MTDGDNLVVDFVARGDSSDEWRMVLVEEGPWSNIEDQLHRIQDRLFGCIDAAVDGLLAEKFPESKGRIVSIELDCYNVPESDVREFFDTFSTGALELPDYKDALKHSPFVKKIAFRLNFST